MTYFARYFNNNFAGCRLIAHARDPHRNRDVSIYLMPGNLTEVGVTDGVDKWICPVICNPFSVDIIKLVRAISNGEPIPTPVKPKEGGARRATIEATPDAPIKSLRRSLLAPTEPTQTTRTRREILA